MRPYTLRAFKRYRMATRGAGVSNVTQSLIFQQTVDLSVVTLQLLEHTFSFGQRALLPEHAASNLLFTHESIQPLQLLSNLIFSQTALGRDHASNNLLFTQEMCRVFTAVAEDDTLFTDDATREATLSLLSNNSLLFSLVISAVLDGILYSNLTYAQFIERFNLSDDPGSPSASEFAISVTHNSFQGLVAATNGFLYAVPDASRYVFKLNTSTDVVTEIGSDHSTVTFKWCGGVLAPNENIYCFPRKSLNILKIVPSAGTTSEFAAATMTVGDNKILGGVIRGDIAYGAPYGQTKVLRIDTSADTSSLITAATGYFGACLSESGSIYFIPLTATTIGKLTTGETWSTFGSRTGYAGGALSPYNDCIYCAPLSATGVLKIDPNDDSTSVFGTATGYSRPCLGPDGKIYCFPEGDGAILVIDPLTDTTSTIGSVNGLPAGSCCAQTGNVYCVRNEPGNNNMIKVTTNNGILIDDQLPLSRFMNKW